MKSTTVFNSSSSLFIFVSFYSLLLSSSSHSVVVVSFSLNSEGEALLSLLNSFSSVPHSIKFSWNNLSSSNTTTPCNWSGVGCNTERTHVVSLDLNGYQITGQLGPQIGNLRYLKSLNLSHNNFNGSIPIELWNCSYLQHLDLSNNSPYTGEDFGFSGQLGPQIGRLRYLTSLDLSWNHFNGSIPIELWNCSYLQHLDLSYNYNHFTSEDFGFSGQLDSQIGFSGQLGPQIGRLRYLTSLDLSYNHFKGPIPTELWNCSHLQHLDLSWNGQSAGSGFSGQLGPQIGRLRYLTSLDLSGNRFNGPIPTELWNNSYLQHLRLNDNNFTGVLPDAVSNLQQLISFRISFNHLSGRIPESLFKISGLESVDLRSNNLNGSIPLISIGKYYATNMKDLILSDNSLDGTIPTSIANCTKLEFIDLSNNGGLSGEIPLGVWRISTLARIDVSNNNLSGELPPVEMTTGLHHLIDINLSDNHFSGLIPEALGINSTGLRNVDLSNNSFSGEIPPNLCFGKQLELMNLGRNQFDGSIPSSSYTENCPSLRHLNLEENNLTGSLPDFEKNSSIYEIDINGNSIQGKIPPSICNLLVSSFGSLDLSDNLMNGTLPHCLADFNHLLSLNLRNNDFSGIIPPNFTSDQLVLLDLNGNRFEGKIPRIHSQELQYVDLGNNQLEDTFPFYLEMLSDLEILVLRSNKLYGSLKRPLHSSSSTSSNSTFFNRLKVLDISSNYFTGDLPLEFVLGLDDMKHIHPVQGYNEGIYYPPILSVVIHKGRETRLNRTFIDDFRAIDMSNNTFQGTIPDSIGKLLNLTMLNLSNNHFNGPIPSSLGNLAQLESLDLSYNRLSGEIPRHLADIHSLAILNLSYNNLTGRIPDEAGQFSTFTNDSFSGNSRLCGRQLSRECGGNNTNRKPIGGELENDDQDSNNNPWSFGWEPVVIGYGCGILIGLVIQYFLFTKAFLYRWFG